MKKFICIFLALFGGFLFSIEAQVPETVTVVSYGEGATRAKAEFDALRSALQQTFGAYVTSKTTIINDELVRDEINAVGRGNVQKYRVVAFVDKGDTKAITIEATISTTKLRKTAESKGMSIDVSGNALVMNYKLAKYQLSSSRRMLLDLSRKLGECSAFYDYSVVKGKETLANGSASIDLTIKCRINALGIQFYENYQQTIRAIEKVLSAQQLSAYKNDKTINLLIEKINNLKESFKDVPWMACFGFKLSDNLGNCIYSCGSPGYRITSSPYRLIMYSDSWDTYCLLGSNGVKIYRQQDKENFFLFKANAYLYLKDSYFLGKTKGTLPKMGDLFGAFCLTLVYDDINQVQNITNFKIIPEIRQVVP